MTTNMTKILFNELGVEQTKKLLRCGECVAIPTETAYGLAADAQNPNAVRKIFAAKGRPTNHPLIVHIPNISHIQRWAQDVPNLVEKLAEAFWPGPLTFILNAREDLDSPVTGGLKTVALRIPAHPLLLDILTDLDMSLAAPSANRYKGLSPTCSEQVLQQLNGRIAGILEGGNCEHGIESTIVDVTGNHVRVLRAGPINASDIEEVIKQPVIVPNTHNDIVPGNVSAHYQPNTPVTLLSQNQLLERLEENNNQNTGYLVFSENCSDALSRHNVSGNRIIKLRDTPAEYARHLYYSLYLLDTPDTAEILVEAPKQDTSWLAVNDRLSRAASYCLADD